jgi:hypothetical protein
VARGRQHRFHRFAVQPPGDDLGPQLAGGLAEVDMAIKITGSGC